MNEENKGMFKITTDSTADLPEDYPRRVAAESSTLIKAPPTSSRGDPWMTRCHFKQEAQSPPKMEDSNDRLRSGDRSIF